VSFAEIVGVNKIAVMTSNDDIAIIRYTPYFTLMKVNRFISDCSEVNNDLSSAVFTPNAFERSLSREAIIVVFELLGFVDTEADM
jgi:hypothetical protein